ncbi:MAG: flagellar hook-length control protein FliK [Thiobacillus sp.]|uniref:flagellar hook-length control protein FliK n=1 Tax=Thiobacillus sp. TaxID=924 RepID=UPI002736B549|nr:flagellar hook-length control protein FliK [Thiobacillus sp.]MDP3583698.1 flagellar hook-length control protein FliK [Thiobacillus sp.]
MNAQALNLNPVQPQSTSGKQADRASSDPSGPPFSEVLSGEMANSRNKDGAATQSTEAQSAQADSRPDTPTPPGTTTQPADAAPEAKPIAVELAAPELPAADPASVAVPAGMPMPLIALGRLDAAAADETDADLLTRMAADNGQPFPPGRKGRAALDIPSGQSAEKTDAGAPKQALAISIKADAQASAKLAASAAFSEQLASSRKIGALNAGEAAPELSGATLRAAPHAAFETLAALHEAAAPKLAPQVGTTAWNQALGEKIVWMAGAAQQTATLTLNPPNMGPLQVVINLSNDQATASFFSAQPEVRQALEAAFPRLREMMNEAGIELGQATVSSETPQQNERDARQPQGIARLLPGSDDALGGLQTGQMPIRQSRGLVDTFA